MSLSRVLLEVDEAGEGFATEITLQVNWGRVLAFKVPGHASAVHPGWTLGALHLALAFIILATLRTVIKQWFSMGPLYMPGQTGWMENLFTVGTFHFTT